MGVASPVFDRCSRTDTRVLRAVVERRLGTLLPADPHTGDLGAALRYAVLAPGKRIRPMLTVLAGWEFGPLDLRSLDAGCALEMVHAASLILDDLPAMDDAVERRGQAATHVKFGEDVAMLCAITLLSRAYGTLSAMQHIASSTRCALIDILARAVGSEGLAGGQYADLRPPMRGGFAAIEEINHKKTGALFLAAFEMAAVIHEADGSAAEVLQSCAVRLGQAYQMLDDLMDSANYAAPGRREDEGKATLLALLGHEAARDRLHSHVGAALSGLKPDGPLARYVRSLFVAPQTMVLVR